MAIIDGMIQIIVKDPSARNARIIMENTSGQFSRSTTPSEQLPMEKKQVCLHENSTLEIHMKATAAKTFDVSTSTVAIPVTQYVAPNGRSGSLIQPAEIMLTAADFGMIVDVACPAGKYLKIGEYKVPAGVAIMPGQGSYDSLNAAKGRVYMDIQATA